MNRLSMISALIVLAATAAAGTPADYPDKALEFQLGPDLTLQASEGLGLAYRVRTSETRGWRFGLSVSGALTDRDHDWESTRDSTYTTEEYKDFDARLVVQKLFYSKPANGASFYWGIGPTVSYGYGDRESIRLDDRWTESTGVQWSAGLSADLGVEWKIVDQLSITARYRWFAMYTSSWGDQDRIDLEDEYVSDSKTNEDRFSFYDSESVRLVVAFHF